MSTGPEIAATLEELGFTHVVWIPDSVIGEWEDSLERSDSLELIRVAREGEAWPLAAGLHIGGKLPIVVMQTTGLFESGDAMRNALFDLGLPLYAIVGHRGYLVPNSADTARKYAEPILRAWGIDYILLDHRGVADSLRDHCLKCRSANIPGIALMAEGKG